jgi:hypothetical protein
VACCCPPAGTKAIIDKVKVEVKALVKKGDMATARNMTRNITMGNQSIMRIEGAKAALESTLDNMNEASGES